MAGQEYTGKDKIVQKMSRDGLTEENLHEGTSKRNKKYQNTKDLIREPPSRAAPLEESFTEEEAVIKKKFPVIILLIEKSFMLTKVFPRKKASKVKKQFKRRDREKGSLRNKRKYQSYRLTMKVA